MVEKILLLGIDHSWTPCIFQGCKVAVKDPEIPDIFVYIKFFIFL